MLPNSPELGRCEFYGADRRRPPYGLFWLATSSQIPPPSAISSEKNEQQHPPPMNGPASSALILPLLVAMSTIVTNVARPHREEDQSRN